MDINEKRVKKMRVIYESAKEFLYEITPKELCEEELEKYFDVNPQFTSKNEILYQLLRSLQNRQMSKNVIGFRNENNKQKFKDILFDYDVDAILGAYNEDTLLSCFENHFSIKNTDSKGNLWKLYAKSIISGCKFLQKFDDANDFDDFINRFSYNEFSAAALPMLLEKEIFGLGFALACDFLKELGYTQYPKPDVHIIEIFHAFGLCEKNDYSAYKAVIEMARIVNQTPYKVDKIFWLIGSGNYYLHNLPHKKNKGNKNKFIEKIKPLFLEE